MLEVRRTKPRPESLLGGGDPKSPATSRTLPSIINQFGNHFSTCACKQIRTLSLGQLSITASPKGAPFFPEVSLLAFGRLVWNPTDNPGFEIRGWAKRTQKRDQEPTVWAPQRWDPQLGWRFSWP